MLSKEEHIARLIFLHIQGMTDNAQEKELNEWRSVSPRHEELFQRMLSSEYVEKSISRFVKTEGERMAATPTESTIRSICSEDKMVPVCSCYCVNIKRGRCFLFFRG